MLPLRRDWLALALALASLAALDALELALAALPVAPVALALDSTVPAPVVAPPPSAPEVCVSLRHIHHIRSTSCVLLAQ